MALEELRKVMAGKFKIVVREDLNDYVPYPPPSLEEAKRFIENIKRSETPQNVERIDRESQH